MKYLTILKYNIIIINCSSYLDLLLNKHYIFYWKNLLNTNLYKKTTVEKAIHNISVIPVFESSNK